ncbi:4-hydroxythreonine-4-phosphate dehydrogenase, partial [Nitratifractor sp.]
MKRVAISVGDLGGIGIELALRAHAEVRTLVDPIYLIDRQMLAQAADLLRLPIPEDFTVVSPGVDPFPIQPGQVDAAAGAYSFASFRAAVELCAQNDADGVCTLPIHKKAWELAGIPYKGHTDALRDFFGREAIMMLGCPRMYVGLYTEHIPLREVPDALDPERLTRFLLDFHRETGAESIAVLGLNPHAGDGGVLGDEETLIAQAIAQANRSIQNPKSKIQNRPFTGPLVPDTAFTPAMRSRFRYYVAMYHDQGLIPLKALHFRESINVSLNLPILRTSVDHGTAFDIAYGGGVPDPTSYLNAVGYIREAKR